MKNLVKTFRAIFARQPLTGLGFVVLTASLAVFFGYARPRSDYVVQLAAIAAASLVVFEVLVTALAVVLIRSKAKAVEDEDEPLAFEARRGFSDGRRWPRLGLPLVDIEVSVVHPEGLRVERVADRERFEAEHRAGGAAVQRRYDVEDPFGLSRLSFEQREARPVRIAPWLGALDRTPALNAVAPGDELPHPRGKPVGDRIEMRPYVRGDPLRLVLWKVYARTGRLMVRTPERALHEETRVHAYLVAGAGDEPSAAAAWVSISRGLFGPQWRFSADGLPGGTSDPDEALVRIVQSRAARGESGLGLSAFLKEIDPSEGARVVAFLPCTPGPWLDDVVRALAPFKGRATAVVGHDGFDAEEPKARSWLRRTPEDKEARDARPKMEALEALRGQLSGSGVEVIVVDRPSGRAFTRALSVRPAA